MTGTNPAQPQRIAGRVRASGAARGRSGQFLDAGVALPHTPSGVDIYTSRSKPIRTTKALSLKDLPSISIWWTELGEQFPGVNLYAELLKAMDWHRADRVKSPKLYFRNWVEKAHSQLRVQVEYTPAQLRERLRVVS